MEGVAAEARVFEPNSFRLLDQERDEEHKQINGMRWYSCYDGE